MRGIDYKSGEDIPAVFYFADADSEPVTSGTATLRVLELQADGTFTPFDFDDDTFKETPTTATASLTHQAYGLWTGIVDATDFTFGNTYVFVAEHSTGQVQSRLFEYGAVLADDRAGESIEDAVWDASTAAHVSAGTFGGDGLSLQEVVDGVWDEAQSAHAMAGTFGQYLDYQCSLIASNIVSIPGATWDVVLGNHLDEDSTGEALARLDVEVSSRLAPTVAERTLDVTATGAAGIDWGNIENAGTTVDLSATTIDSCDDVTGAVGSVSGSVASVTGDVGGKVLGGGGNSITGVGARVHDSSGADVAPAATALTTSDLSGLSTFDPTSASVNVGEIAGEAITEQAGENFNLFFDNDDLETSKVVEDVSGGSGSGGGGEADWSSTERAQIRYRLGLDGATDEPDADANLATKADVVDAAYWTDWMDIDTSQGDTAQVFVQDPPVAFVSDFSNFSRIADVLLTNGRIVQTMASGVFNGGSYIVLGLSPPLSGSLASYSKVRLRTQSGLSWLRGGGNNSLTNAMLENNMITADKFSSGAINNNALGDNAITASKIHSTAVEAIQDGLATAADVEDATYLTDWLDINAGGSSSTSVRVDEYPPEFAASMTGQGRAIELLDVSTGAIYIRPILFDLDFGTNHVFGVPALEFTLAAGDKARVVRDSVWGLVAQVYSNAITASSFASNAITAEKINNGALTNAKFADNAISASKIAADALAAIRANLLLDTTWTSAKAAYIDAAISSRFAAGAWRHRNVDTNEHADVEITEVP